MKAPSGDTTDLKAQLRRELRLLRSTISPNERLPAAVAAACHLAALPEFRRARRLALYLDTGSELSTAPLIDRCWSLGKTVCVPRVRDGGAMHFVELLPGAPLRRDRYGIRTPALRARRVSLRALDLVVVPLLGFDARGQRIGSGAGYYDRVLGRARLRVGYAYAAQEIARVPAEPWDVALNLVVTEQAVIRCRP